MQSLFFAAIMTVRCHKVNVIECKHDYFISKKCIQAQHCLSTQQSMGGALGRTIDHFPHCIHLHSLPTLYVGTVHPWCSSIIQASVALDIVHNLALQPGNKDNTFK